MDSSGPTSPTVIGTDAVRSATYDFLSESLSNYGPIAYRFRDVAILAEKRQFFSSPLMYLTSLLRVLPPEFCNAVSVFVKLQHDAPTGGEESVIRMPTSLYSRV